jgi:hypothetical protein
MRERRGIGADARTAAAFLVLLAAGCVAPPSSEPPPSRAWPPPRTAPRPQARPTQPPAPAYTLAGLEGVIGRDARALEARFGKPDLDIKEGNARKLQFAGRACVLDFYLYPPRGGGEPIVTYVDARLPDGRDVDRASCVAALARRPAD